MKHFLFFSLLLASAPVRAQQSEDFRIIDIAQKEIRLFNAYKDKDSAERSRVFADSLYQPYKAFWAGYMGEEENFVRWANKALTNLYGFNQKNGRINGGQLLRQFDVVKKGMEALTGYRPKGEWYVVYGPAWANLGGLSGGTMFIDLSHHSNSSNDAIMMMFPHEITHQIYANVNTHHDTTALGSIIGEGFAVYMNQLYWKKSFTLAEHLGYPEAGLRAVEEQDAAIRQFFEDNKYSADKTTIDKFRNRSFHLQPGLPGAIGYYIGYKIIDAYVRKHGAESWKDVFTKSPEEIYTTSGY
ncbi:MAG TPA: DUF2268 domain-containing putative Zn-dependent protease [Chitinophagaceae bacterium]